MRTYLFVAIVMNITFAAGFIVSVVGLNGVSDHRAVCYLTRNQVEHCIDVENTGIVKFTEAEAENFAK